MSDYLLEIKDLNIASAKHSLVKGISLNLKENSIHGLVGESGSGKTLTALSIPGLLPEGLKATSGTIHFKSGTEFTDLLKLSASGLNKIRGNKIAMIFQEPMTSLNPSMRCGLQAMEPMLNHAKISKKEARERTLQLFREVKLPNENRIFNSWPHELSGGQKQRVMIAMALSTSPDLLIADEPTTALDVTVQKNILDLLVHLKNKFNLSILFISHDLMVINQICDFVSVMYQGEIVEQNTKTQIIHHPTRPYTKGLLACKPKLYDKPHRLPTIKDYLKDPDIQIKTKKKSKSIDTESPILEVRDLEVSFGEKQIIRAVKKVSFDVYKGETLGLVGESGCGKTTLGRAILQLVKAENGLISYKGIPLNKLGEKTLRKVRKNIQIVFQDPYSSLNPGKTIGNIIGEPIRIHHLQKGSKKTEEAVQQLLEQVGLPAESVNLYPHQFSGGQRQRIGIARALACRPEFIILDESVSALDVSVQAQILNLLNDLKEQYALTYIFISHDLTVVNYMSDRVMVMSEGKIVESGTSDEVYRSPKQQYTKDLIKALPT